MSVQSPSKMHTITLPIGPEKNLCYVAYCATTREAVVIDPAFEQDKIKNCIEELQLKLRWILATHGHWDHAQHLAALKKFFPTAKTAAHSGDHSLLAKLHIHVDQVLADQDELPLGLLKIKVIATPGHTEGGVSFLIENDLFTGDALFIDQCGRTDLPGGNERKLFESLQKIKQLPKDIRILPGHDYGPKPWATLGEQCLTNPALSAISFDVFQEIP